MPETRGEKLFFGVVMSITMAVGMEIYNVAISMGYALQPGGLSGMTSAVFPAALAEAAYMSIDAMDSSSNFSSSFSAVLRSARYHLKPS